jgi:hypothetical protein
VKVKEIIGVANVLLYESSFSSSTIHPLELSTILDSGTTLHIFNDLSRFTNFRKAPSHHVLTVGDHEVPILGYGDVHITVMRPNGGTGTLRLKDAAFCTDFTTNLVSFRQLREKGYYWNNKGMNNYLARHDDTVIWAAGHRIRPQQELQRRNSPPQAPPHVAASGHVNPRH